MFITSFYLFGLVIFINSKFDNLLKNSLFILDNWSQSNIQFYNLPIFADIMVGYFVNLEKNLV